MTLGGLRTLLRRCTYLRLRQSLCPHRVRAGDIRRVSDVSVECPCLLCGKVLKAPYGLALDAREWVQ